MTRITTFIGLVLFAGLVAAQEAGRQPREPGARRDPAARRDAADTGIPRGEAAGQRPIDKFLVQCLITDNKGEIALAKFAQQRAENKEVKAFAEQMITDHTEFLNQLAKLEGGAAPGRDADATDREATDRDRDTERAPRAGGAPADTPRAERAEGRREARESREERRERVAETRETVRGGGGVVDRLAAIKQELGQRCLATAQRELENKEGAEFDRCFMGMQVMGHLKMADELSVFKNHASPNLQPIISQGLEKTTEHLAHAKKLAKELEKSGSATAKRDQSTQEK